MELREVRVVLRSIDPLGALALHHVQVVLGRGPFDVDDERRLFQEHDVEAVISRNSGGEATRAKLVAARDLGVAVAMVRRPARG